MDQNVRELLNEMNFAADIQRSDLLQNLREKEEADRENVDVSGYWKGYDSKGKGLVEYRGRIYTCTVLARRVKQYGAKVNLRRTPNGNYVNW